MTSSRWLLRSFYVVVLLVALAGQSIAAVAWLHWPLLVALVAVGAVELGGVALSAHADARRQLGERALAARLLSAAVAGGAVAVNWLGHTDHMQGGFFAGMSALGYAVWLIDSAARRRDQLRAARMLPPTPPAYGAWQWLRHPALTARARALALADPSLGLYRSLQAAADAVRRERRRAAISTVLHRKIRAAVDPTTADIAVAVYDLDEIAHRLADGADYDGLTALIAADLAPARLAVDPPTREPRRTIALDPTPALTATPSVEPTPEETVVEVDSRPVLDPELRRGIEHVFTTTRQPLSTTVIDSGPPPAEEPPPPPPPPPPAVVEEPVKPPRPTGSLRRRVHAVLDEHVPAGDARDNTQLLQLVTHVLDLNDLEQTTAGSYVTSWRRQSNGRPLETLVPGQK